MKPLNPQPPAPNKFLVSRFGAMRVVEVFAVSATVCGIETMIVTDWLRGDVTVSLALWAHASVVSVMTVWLYAVSLRGLDLRYAASMVLMTAVLGPYGAWGSLLALCLYAPFRGKIRNIEEWYRALMPDLTRSLPQRIYDSIASGALDATRDKGVASFIDVLTFGTAAQRQALVALTTENFRPAFAPILSKALQHDDPAVRIMAATAVSQIMTNVHQQTEELKARVVQNPGDPARLCALGLHLKQWADMGLLDAEQADDLRRSALEALMDSLELDSDNEEAIAAVGNLLVALGECRDAAFWLDRYPMVRDANSSAYLAYLEALYNLGDLGALRKKITAPDVATVVAKLHPDAQATLSLWLGLGKSAVQAR